MYTVCEAKHDCKEVFERTYRIQMGMTDKSSPHIFQIKTEEKGYYLLKDPKFFIQRVYNRLIF